MNKNVHLLPTDKPSRLLKTIPKGNFILSKENTAGSHWENFNLYITNDEAIKEEDWFISLPRETIHKCTAIFENNLIDKSWENREVVEITKSDCKKIIATTGQDLIKNGVQSIGDEFLEWFVENPSCEYVKLKDSKTVKEHIWDGTNDGEIIWEKEIIIPPQEESKYIEDKFEFESRIINEVWDRDEEPKQEKLTYTEAVKKEERIFNSIMMKQETLEEAKENWANEGSWCCPVSFEAGATWQQEQDKNKYSDKEVKHIIREALQSALVTVDLEQWFKQFKKK